MLYISNMKRIDPAARRDFFSVKGVTAVLAALDRGGERPWLKEDIFWM
jgi:hypothetical protein